jgi:hypothetical protein
MFFGDERNNRIAFGFIFLPGNAVGHDLERCPAIL